jgi:hypothetical protein
MFGPGDPEIAAPALPSLGWLTKARETPSGFPTWNGLNEPALPVGDPVFARAAA